MNDYQLAKTLTESQIEAALNSWDDKSSKAIEFKTLVRLGDSKALAMATVLNGLLKPDTTSFYTQAYCS